MRPLIRRTFAAIEAVVYVACFGKERPIRSREICEYQGVTLRYLEMIMQALVRAKILKGIRGPKGGYLLAQDRRKIMVSDIYDAVLTMDTRDAREGGSEIYKQVLAPIQQHTYDVTREYYASISLKELCDQVEERDIVPDEVTKADFTI